MPKSDRGCFSAKRKREAVLRLLRGEELDLVSRELGVNGSTLSKWRESFGDRRHNAPYRNFRRVARPG